MTEIVAAKRDTLQTGFIFLSRKFNVVFFSLRNFERKTIYVGDLCLPSFVVGDSEHEILSTLTFIRSTEKNSSFKN
jgi:hypothetical protein